jgi:hypothetical protein
VSLASSSLPYTLKILHFGLMTIVMIGVRGMGEITVGHISDSVGLGHFSGPTSVNPGPFPEFLPLVWFPELPTSYPEAISSQSRAVSSVGSFCGTRRESTGGKGRTSAEFGTVWILMNSQLY